jgi:putative NAD(P)H nitroreductase
MELKQVYETRRSINFFDANKDVEDNLLKDIINLAVLAPSAFNLQPWEILAVKSKEAKEKLQKLANNQIKIGEAPVTLIIVGDKNGYDKSNSIWEQTLKAFSGNVEAVEGMQNAAAFLYGSSEDRKLKFAESNAGLLGMSIMYAAKSLGVDSHPMSGMDFDGIRKEFGLDENKTVVMAICLGYLAEDKTLYPRAYRKGFYEIVKEV